MTIEFVITHDGSNWRAQNELFTLSAPSLPQLDIQMRDLLKKKGIVKKGGKADVHMVFDNATIPAWIRPYAQHYFNRIVEVEGDIS
jgi:hypothetical protein